MVDPDLTTAEIAKQAGGLVTLSDAVSNIFHHSLTFIRIELKFVLARSSNVWLHLHHVLLHSYDSHSHLQRFWRPPLPTSCVGNGAYWSFLFVYSPSYKAVLWFLSKQTRKFLYVRYLLYFDMPKSVPNFALFSFNDVRFTDWSSS